MTYITHTNFPNFGIHFQFTRVFNSLFVLAQKKPHMKSYDGNMFDRSESNYFSFVGQKKKRVESVWR